MMMMISTGSRALVAAASLLLTTMMLSPSTTTVVTAAMVLTNSPQQYFGGSDHAAYLDHLDTGLDAGSGVVYEDSVFVPSDSGAGDEGSAIHWAISDGFLYVVVAARAEGWLGFGISETGGMRGGDVVVFEAAKPDELMDGYFLEDRRFYRDECQHWELLSSAVSDDGFIVFEGRRPLDTGDKQDHAIYNDADTWVPPARIITAWGDSPTVSYHGPNTGRSTIRFYRPPPPSPPASSSSSSTTTVSAAQLTGTESSVFREQMKEQADGFIELRAKDHVIKPVDTEYANFCWSWEDIVGMLDPPQTTGLITVVGIEPIIEDKSRRHLHHFTFSGNTNPLTNTSDPSQCQMIFDMVYAWAPGEPEYTLPDNVGLLISPNNGRLQNFRMEVHYDNPDLIEGGVDNSGLRLYYSNTPREHEIGILIVGDPIVNLNGVPVGDGLNEWTFDCPGGCSSLALSGNTQPITVIKEQLHMHKSGLSIYNEQRRDGEVIRKAKVEFWDFAQQGAPPIQQEPFEIKPGDSFKTVCRFDSSNNETYGLSSSAEMCQSFMTYYPRQALYDGAVPWMCGPGYFEPQCVAEYETRPLSSNSELGRVFGASNEGQCRNTVGSFNEVTSGGTVPAGVLGAASTVLAVLIANAVSQYLL